jgi:hypothetical protein
VSIVRSMKSLAKRVFAQDVLNSINLMTPREFASISAILVSLIRMENAHNALPTRGNGVRPNVPLIFVRKTRLTQSMEHVSLVSHTKSQMDSKEIAFIQIIVNLMKSSQSKEAVSDAQFTMLPQILTLDAYFQYV